MKLSRRELLAIAGSAAILPASRARASHASPKTTAFIQVFLHGGIDAMLTTNPRRRGEVDTRVDVPFEEAKIVTRNGMRIGPTLAGLDDMLDHVAIVNGVRVMSLAHKSATDNVRQMRSVFPSDQHEGIAGTIGARLRGERPLDQLVLGTGWSVAAGYRPMGRTLVMSYGGQASPGLLDGLYALGQLGDRRDVIARVLADQLRANDPGTHDAVEVAEALVRHAPKAPPGTPPTLALDPERDPGGGKLALQIRDAIYALRHDLTRSVYLDMQFNFDSHGDNLDTQTRGMRLVVAGLRALRAELATIPGQHGGTLADETMILVSSELGRFPFINQWNGKDHFPEFPFLLFGPGVRPGQYGDTDRLMTGQPVAFSTGKPSSTANDRCIDVDDLGVTLLDRFGVHDPTSRGYVGRTLDFLFV